MEIFTSTETIVSGYTKLRILLNQIINVWNIKGVKSGCKDIGIRKFEILNSFESSHIGYRDQALKFPHWI